MIKKKTEMVLTAIDMVKLHIRGELIPMMTNKEYALEDRWKLFEAVQEMLPIQHYGSGQWGIFPGESEYDDYGVDRYETVHFIQRVEFLREMLEDYARNEEPLRYTNEDIEAWQERVLESGYRGFRNDW